MLVKIHKTSNMPGMRSHKGSSLKLVAYLERKCSSTEGYYDTFFSQEETYLTPATVMRKIDNNHKQLMDRDDKFYRISINPSQDETTCLIRWFTGREVTEFEQLTVDEQGKTVDKLKKFASLCMNLYTRIFNRKK